MPVYRRKLGDSGYYIRTRISGQVITYQLLIEGQQRLHASGILEGMVFERQLLIGLIHSGLAYTNGTGICGRPDNNGQMDFDFGNDPVPEEGLPMCSSCTSPDDLHLVTIAAPPLGAFDTLLLCGSCRRVRSNEINISVPIILVSRNVASRLRDLKFMGNADRRVNAYLDSLEKDYKAMWEEYRQQHERPKAGFLPLEGDAQTSLF